MNPLVLWFHKLGSPPYFYRFAGKWLPWLYALALIAGVVGFYGALRVMGLAAPNWPDGVGF